MIDIINEFIGAFPDVSSLYDLSILIQYMFAGCLLLLVSCSIYCIFGSIIRVFRR